MSKPHKHAGVIKAWADGKTVQVASCPEPTYSDPLAQREPNWRDVISSFPTFNSDMLYRIKPEPLEWQAEREAFARGERVQWRSKQPQHEGHGWLDVPTDKAIRGHIELAFNEPTNEFRIPHKWQNEIDAWERGEDVEVRDDNGLEGPLCTLSGLVGKSWAKIDRSFVPNPMWLTVKGREYRVAPKPHKWQREMDAQACGEKVQFRPSSDDDWGDGHWSFDDPEGEYRIKPKTETHKIRVALMQHTSSSAPFTRTVFTYGEATTVERQAAFVRWLCDWQEVEVEASPKCEQGSWKDLHGGGSDGGVAAVKQALEDCAKFGAGAYQVGFDLGKPGGDHSCLFFRRVHINK